MQVQLGRYQTRSARIVEITASNWIDERQGDGTTIRKRVWSGALYKADGKTFDCEYRWDDSGRLLNQRGVASDKDLAILIEGRGGVEQEPGGESELRAENERLKAEVAQLRTQRDNFDDILRSHAELSKENQRLSDEILTLIAKNAQGAPLPEGAQEPQPAEV